jgi:hypothetical protein
MRLALDPTVGVVGVAEDSEVRELEMQRSVVGVVGVAEVRL